MDISNSYRRINDRWYALREGTVTRIGDARREEVTAHVSTGRALGFFTEAERERLTEIALKARYEHELYWVTRELEGVPEQLPVVRDKDYWDEVYAATARHWTETPWLYAVIYFGVLSMIGLILLITGG